MSKVQDNDQLPVGPGSAAELEQRLRHVFDDTFRELRGGDDGETFSQFETRLWTRTLLIFRLFAAWWLALRHERLDVSGYESHTLYRIKDWFAERQLKTLGGLVAYGRVYLGRRGGGSGWCPLDAALGITADGFSWGVMSLVTRLATRVSYAAAVKYFELFVGWAPSTEAVEECVLGLGARTWTYAAAAPPPEDEGEVLIIEVDGKATPTATADELAKRRGPRRKHEANCPCGCQRHRGQQQRQENPKKRRKKGDKSKNGRSITLVVMYTLKRGPDGRLHGPINKRVWGSYAKRRVMLEWARAEATRRGFPPGTEGRVQILTDGEKCLQRLRQLFPGARFTLDVRHVQERLWLAGRQLHAEGSDDLLAWVEAHNRLLLAGQTKELLEALATARDSISKTGPGTKTKRATLQKQIDYLTPRQDMLRYDEVRAQDLVMATGNVEGAARYVIGERMDCSGMRWIPQRAEALLHLRCIELNGDWEHFMAWTEAQHNRTLRWGQPAQVRTSEPTPLRKVA